MTVYREPGPSSEPDLWRDQHQCWRGDPEVVARQHERERAEGEAKRAAWRETVEAVKRTRKAVRR